MLWRGAPVTLAAGVLVVLLIRATGGARSDLLPLLFLPIILAIVRCSPSVAIGTGIGMGLANVLLFHPGASPAQGAMRALAIVGVTVVGVVYATQVQLDRDKLRTTVQEQEDLLNASQIINSSEKLDHALDSSLLMLHRLLPGFRAAAIYLADETERFMERAAVTGVPAGDISSERISLTGDRPGWQPNDPRPCYIPDTATREDEPLASIDPRARSVLCVSLRSLRVPIGMILVSSDRPNAFDAADVNMLRSFADRIGFPLQKIRIQEGLQGLAFTDGLTGLYNFRSFRAHLDDELKRSQRYARPLSLIVLDLDGFKGVNDEYGHPAGDLVLVGVANIIRRAVREIDLPVRYGGEEFAIICPETAGAEAAVVADRIRTAVEAAHYEVAPGVRRGVTISAGVATYPLHADNGTDLLQCADAALYTAKRSGKNRVVPASADISDRGELQA